MKMEFVLMSPNPKLKDLLKEILLILLVYTLTSYAVFIYKLFSVGLALKLRIP